MISVYPPTSTSVVSYSGATVDAFGRLRISTPYTIFDSQNRYDKDPQFDEATSTGGTASYNANDSTVSLGVTTTSGSEVVRQSFRSMPYQPGKSLLFMGTAVFNTPKTNLRQRVGYFNTQNGVFLQTNDTTISFVLRSFTSGSVVETVVSQANWNGDKLDGTGASGITLDISKAQIIFMDFEWLGVGAVRCGFNINGTFVICHTFENSNVLTTTYMTTAILPIRYEITNTGTTASSSTLKQICCTVISEAGYEESKVEQVARRTTVLSGIGSTFVPLVSIRLNSGSPGAVILPANMEVLTTAAGDYEISLFKNATLTGAAYNTSTFLNVDYDTAATAMSGGTIFRQGYIGSSAVNTSGFIGIVRYNFDAQLGSSISGTSDVITLGIRELSGVGTPAAIGSITFYDITI